MRGPSEKARVDRAVGMRGPSEKARVDDAAFVGTATAREQARSSGDSAPLLLAVLHGFNLLAWTVG